MARHLHISLISVSQDRPEGFGKVDLCVFTPVFASAAERRGMSFAYFQSADEFLRRGPSLRRELVIPIYNEDFYTKIDLPLVKSIERRAIFSPRALVANRSRICAIVGDKGLTNNRLSASGIVVPERCQSADHRAVFSNAVMGSATEVEVFTPGMVVPPERYNTELIDTRYSFDGNEYYVCIRAVCFGPSPISVFVRARPVSENNPSVHAKDTPLDSRLLNHLHEVFVDGRRHKIESICQSIYNCLGLAFYAHDLLPEKGSGRIFVCETGFKLDDFYYRNHIASLASELNFWDEVSEASIDRAAEAVRRYFNA